MDTASELYQLFTDLSSTYKTRLRSLNTKVKLLDINKKTYCRLKTDIHYQTSDQTRHRTEQGLVRRENGGQREKEGRLNRRRYKNLKARRLFFKTIGNTCARLVCRIPSQTAALLTQNCLKSH